MYLLVTYDVSTETREGKRRLRKIAQICLNYGQRVQKSVFECQVSESQYVMFHHQLVHTIDTDVDSLRIYRLRDTTSKTVKHFGTNKPIDFHEPLLL